MSESSTRGLALLLSQPANLDLLKRRVELLSLGIPHRVPSLELTELKKLIVRREHDPASDESVSFDRLAGGELEKIIYATERPSLFVFNGSYDAANAGIWKSALDAARDLIKPWFRSVGRLELENAPWDWVGTAWMLDDRIAVTNRHVALQFAARKAKTYAFRKFEGFNQRCYGAIDFIEENGVQDRDSFDIDQVLYIAPNTSTVPDVALVKLKSNVIPPVKITLSTTDAVLGQDIAVIGFPADDSFETNAIAKQQIFGDIYNVKRLSPGKVLAASATSSPDVFLHDASTLAGNSGSVVLRLDTGEALGLHYSGKSGYQNRAVKASYLRNLLVKVAGKAYFFSAAGPGPGPVTINADLEKAATASSLADYDTRDGYRSDFLGMDVPLPTYDAPWIGDVSIPTGAADPVLTYEHFSLVMCTSRRMALFTASNVDGNLAYDIKRKKDTWIYDPRLPSAMQTGPSVYTSNDLDRGHMVRRLDPVWGEQRGEGERAEKDTFHYTNSCPQHKDLNQNRETWQGLENYVLDSAKTEGFKISVFTGPVLGAEDPEYRGVQLPLQFWKIVAFLAEDGQLAASGYLLSQEELVDGIEFAYGEFGTYQVPIADIEDWTGLKFGPLTAVDVLASAEEGVAAGAPKARLLQRPDDMHL